MASRLIACAVRQNGVRLRSFAPFGLVRTAGKHSFDCEKDEQQFLSRTPGPQMVYRNMFHRVSLRPGRPFCPFSP